MLASTMIATVRRAAPLFLLLTSASFGYIRSNSCSDFTPAVCTATPVPLQRVDNAGIQFYMNNLVVAGAQSSAGATGQNVTVISPNSNPQAAARAALTTWNNAGANVTFLPLMTTTSGHNTPLPPGAAPGSPDGLMVILIASAPADVSLIGGALAVTATFAASSPGQDPFNSALNLVDGSIVDTDILLNPEYNFSTDGSTPYDLQAVLTHEFGHSLGANHTGVLGATMFQYNHVNQRFLSTDDLAFINSFYPATSNPQPLGTISGTVTAAGAIPAPYAMLAFIDSTQGINLGGLTNPDGTYSIQAPPGNYTVYAEPFNGVVTTGFLYLTYLTAAQSAAILSFQPTLLPATVAVTANNTAANTNITVTGGTSTFSLANTIVGFGAAGAKGDISTLSGIDGPFQLPSGTVASPSGQSMDIGFSGPGFVSTLTASNFQVFGQGISITAVHTDSSIVNNQPIIRVTLKITGRQTASLATMFVSNGGSTLSMTGLLDIGPPTPSFTAPDVVDAASNIVGTGTVSPGEYVTLYGAGAAPSTGPYLAIGYTNTGYIMGYLPQDLGGVSVTFDGVPAPIFFTGGGDQINLQVPFEVAGKTSTQVVTSFFGSPSTAVTLPVVPVHPALFVYPAAPAAYAANVAASGSVSTNTVSNPAARGSLIIVVGTGIGLPAYQAPGTANPILTGAPAPVPPSANLNANGWTCVIGGVSATVAYAAWFNGFTAEAEWYVTVPASLTVTGAVPIQFTLIDGRRYAVQPDGLYRIAGVKSALLLTALCWCVLPAPAQEIRIYSEFERFDPFGNPAAPDRDLAPREILSPTIARNGHLTVHVVVTGPPGTNYFLYAASNPPDILKLSLYREYFVPCGTGYCPDWLAPVPSPSFGAIPESLYDERKDMASQTTRCYLLDIYAIPDTPPRRVRVEALLKVGTWQVAPMEVRIMEPTVPDSSRVLTEENIAPVDAPASATAQRQLLRHLAGLPPQVPLLFLRVRDFIQRNAAEDMLLAGHASLPELNFLAWSPVRWPRVGSEWYLKVRDFLHNRSGS
jgi:uncharacterized protein (TIGR03437 family)